MLSQAKRSALREGLRVMMPMVPGVIPFAVTAGLAAVDAGLSPAAALASSVLIFAGASQLAAMQLIDGGGLPVVILLTAWIINLRFAMYSASLAAHFAPLPKRWKWPLSYLLTDQAYALTILRAQQHHHEGHLHWFYVGGAVLMWLVWQSGTLLGILVGGQVPQSWGLGFAVPLIFLGLLVPAVHNRPTLVAALVGGLVATLAHALPMNLGLFLGAVSGIAAGVLADRLARQPEPPAP